MQFPTDVNDDVTKRLRRIEGQVRGLQRMIDERQPCKDIVTQLAAVQGALDRVGFRLMASALACPDGQERRDELEQLFLKLT